MTTVHNSLNDNLTEIRDKTIQSVQGYDHISGVPSDPALNWRISQGYFCTARVTRMQELTSRNVSLMF